MCGTQRPKGGVFTQFRVFPISTSVDITVYQIIRKNVLYLFYNIARRNIKKLISYINTALCQSAFRINKCYIMIYVCLVQNTLIGHQKLPCVQDKLSKGSIYDILTSFSAGEWWPCSGIDWGQFEQTRM